MKPEEQATRWNVSHRTGTRVRVKTDDGSHVETCTRSQAFIEPGIGPVVWLRIGGRVCRYHLDRITPAY